MKARAQAAELGRFVLVGGSAVTVDFLVYFAIVGLVPVVPVAVAKGISFIVGAVVAFFLNRSFGFRAGQQPEDTSRQVVSFTLLYLTTLMLNNGMNALALGQGAPKILAWFLATGTSTVANFLGMKLIVFRRKKTAPRDEKAEVR
jgi:putative flippase GtrA